MPGAPDGVGLIAATVLVKRMRCVCRHRLSRQNEAVALPLIPAGCLPERTVRCMLVDHNSGDHFALVDSVRSNGMAALWVSWTCDGGDGRLVELPDCSEPTPGGEGDACMLFVRHAGEHTFVEVEEPCGLAAGQPVKDSGPRRPQATKAARRT